MIDRSLPEATGNAFAILAGIAVFLTVWVYAAARYGTLVGIGLGWIPAVFIGFLATGLIRWLWPLVVVVGLMAAVLTVVSLVSN